MECTGEDATQTSLADMDAATHSSGSSGLRSGARSGAPGRAARPTAGPSFPSPGAAPSDDAPSHRSGNIEGSVDSGDATRGKK